MILVASTVQYPTLCIYLLGVVDTPGEAVASGRAMTTAAIYWHQTLEPRNCQGYAGNRFGLPSLARLTTQALAILTAIVRSEYTPCVI